MITLAVFDMAGTTINDGGAVYQALKQSVEETGVTVSESDLQTWMGTEKRAAITALITLGGGDPNDPSDKIDATFERFRSILAELYAAVPPTPIAGVPEAIAALRADGVRVALTTGFSRDVATGVLGELGWEIGTKNVNSSAGSEGASTVAIDALVCGDEVAMGRPAPYMIHRAMELTETLSTDEVLVAGDTLVDVAAGANAGAKITLGVLSGKLVREDFAGKPQTDLLESVAQVPDYLRNRPDLRLQDTSLS